MSPPSQTLKGSCPRRTSCAASSRTRRAALFLKVRLNVVLCGNWDEIGVRATLVAELIRMAPKLAQFVDGMELELDPEA